MKKIIFIIFLFLSCYIIYGYTQDTKINYLAIGDGLSKGITPYNQIGYGYSDYLADYLKKNNKLKTYNKRFTNTNYRVIDIINLLDQNKTTNIDNKSISINQLIKKANLITISVGMNEIYYKLSVNNNDIYQYVDELIKDIDNLLNKISKNSNSKVFVMGYYNSKNIKTDLFTYSNFHLQETVAKYKYTYIDLSKELNNKQEFFSNPNSFIPTLNGYKKISQKIVENLKEY